MKQISGAATYNMMRNRFLREICGAVFRGAGLTSAATALVLCTPVLERSFEPERTPAPAALAPEPASRVDVQLKRGDTLLSLLARHGVKPPSAHDLLAKVGLTGEISVYMQRVSVGRPRSETKYVFEEKLHGFSRAPPTTYCR